MELFDDYPQLSDKIAEVLFDTINNKSNSSICFATGNTPLQGYRKFVDLAHKNNLNCSNLIAIKLDEWCGLKSNDKATCEYFLRSEIIEPLKILDEHYISFNSEAMDYHKEANRIKGEISKLGEIDLAILGFGKNGHIGLNEPADQIVHDIHVVNLDDKTKTHEMLKKAQIQVCQGITLGFSELFRAKKVIVAIAGEEKEEAFKKFRQGYLSMQIPASILRLHPNVEFYIDKNSFHHMEW